MRIDAERLERGRKLAEIVQKLREAHARLDESNANMRRLYGEAKREFGLTTEELELEIIKHREATGRKVRADGARVYFAHLPAKSLVKIGFSIDVPNRIKALAGTLQADLRLLGSIDGDRVAERVLHHQFRRHREHGELFAWVPIHQYVHGMIARNSALLPGQLS